MPRTPEPGTRYNQKIKIFGLLTEGDIILYQGSGEHIEGSARLHHMIAQIAEPVNQEIAVGLIDGDIRG